jgi:hypothetical protein
MKRRDNRGPAAAAIWRTLASPQQIDQVRDQRLVGSWADQWAALGLKAPAQG